jgi:hypothetical protein
MTGPQIDFASMPCMWEVPEDEALCLKPGAGCLPELSLAVYCREHLTVWRVELDRQAERDRPKLPGLQDWYRQAARKAGVMR